MWVHLCWSESVYLCVEFWCVFVRSGSQKVTHQNTPGVWDPTQHHGLTSTSSSFLSSWSPKLPFKKKKVQSHTSHLSSTLSSWGQTAGVQLSPTFFDAWPTASKSSPSKPGTWDQAQRRPNILPYTQTWEREKWNKADFSWGLSESNKAGVFKGGRNRWQIRVDLWDFKQVQVSLTAFYNGYELLLLKL